MHISSQPLCKIFIYTIRLVYTANRGKKEHAAKESEHEWRGLNKETNRTYVAGNEQSFELILWQCLTRNVGGMKWREKKKQTCCSNWWLSSLWNLSSGFIFCAVLLWDFLRSIFYVRMSDWMLQPIHIVFGHFIPLVFMLACNKFCTLFEIRINYCGTLWGNITLFFSRETTAVAATGQIEFNKILWIKRKVRYAIATAHISSSLLWPHMKHDASARDMSVC